jgi:large subunit ribosomal protein L13
MKTYSTKSSDLTPQWHVIDASGKTLGRLASVVATLLMGKHKPIYTPNLNTGDFVIVVNAAKVRVTGNKAQQKVYYRHSGYPGGLKSVTLERMMQTHPTRVIEYAVKGMLPHNRLGRDMLRRLKVYAGDTHPHQAQVGKSEGEGAVER